MSSKIEMTTRVCFLGFIVAIALTLGSYYFEYVKELVPCSLCYIQRYLVILLGVSFLVGLLPLSRVLKIIHAGVVVFLSGVGIASAARHVWLQQQPADALTSCLPTDLVFVMQNFPITDALLILIQGSDCAETTWQFLGLSMPAWVLGFFILFMGLGLCELIRAWRMSSKVDIA